MLTEADLCKAFVQQFRRLAALSHFGHTPLLIHIANERKSTGNRLNDMLYNKHLKAMGMLPGAPDYLISYQGGYHAFIEFKRSSKSIVQPSQKKFGEDCSAMEIPYLLTWCVVDALEFVRKHSVSKLAMTVPQKEELVQSQSHLWSKLKIK